MYRSQRNPTSAEKISQLLEELKTEFTTLENDLNICKMTRDDYERKLEAQLMEFQTMKSTIMDLETNYRNNKTMKRQREDNEERPHKQPRIDRPQFVSSSGGPPSMNTAPPMSRINNQSLKPPPPSSLSNSMPTHSSPLTSSLSPSLPSSILNQPTMPSSMSVGSLSSSMPSSLSSGNMPSNMPSGNMPSGNMPSNMSSNMPNSMSGPMGGNNMTGPIGGINNSIPSNMSNSNQSMQNAQRGVPGYMVKPNNINSVSHLTQGHMQTSPTSNIPLPFDNGNCQRDNMVKEEGSDWVVVHTNFENRNVGIDLKHNLEHSSVVCCVRFSSDGKLLATGSNKVAKIYNVENGKLLKNFTSGNTSGTIEKEESYVRSVCFSPDNRYLIAGAEDKTVKVWDINSNQQKFSLEGHTLDIYSLDFSRDNKFLISGGGDGKAKIWNMDTGKCLYTLGNDETGPKEGVTSVAVSPDGRICAAGSLDCVVRLWDTQTGKFLESFKGHEDSVYSVAFSPDGKTLASGSLDKTLKLWDLSGHRSGYRCIGTLTGHRDYILSVAFSPTGKWLVSGSKDRSVQFWDPRTSVLHSMLQGHKNSVISVAFSPETALFATGSGDFRARLWNFHGDDISK